MIRLTNSGPHTNLIFVDPRHIAVVTSVETDGKFLRSEITVPGHDYKLTVRETPMEIARLRRVWSERHDIGPVKGEEVVAVCVRDGAIAALYADCNPLVPA